MRKAFSSPASGLHPDADFRLTQSRFLSRSKTHVTREDELAAGAPDTAPDLRDTNDLGFRKTDEGVHQNREAGNSNASQDVAKLARQIEMGKVKLRVLALEDDNSQG